MHVSIGHKLTAAFLGAVAILLATAVVSYRNTRELLLASDAITHSQQVLDAVERILARTRDAESAARAYALAPDTSFRRQVQEAGAGVETDAQLLASLADGDTILAAGSARFAETVARRFEQFARGMAVRDTGGTAALRALIGNTERLAVDSALRAVAEGLVAREREQLAARSRIAQARGDRGNVIVRFSLVLVGILAPLTFLIVRNDVVVRREAERSLAETEARFRAAVDGSMDAFYILRAVRDADGEVLDFEFVDVNARTEGLLGHTRSELLGQRLCELIPANRSLGFFDRYRRVMESGVMLEEEVEVAGREVHAAWIHHQIVPLADGVAITSRDVTERKRNEETLRAMSLVDELTGLYNRRGFFTLAQQQLKLARRGHREVLLLFIDMDDFKEINDTFGHQEGDGALMRAAEILKHTFRDSDIIARMGGDEFVVLATDTGSAGSEVIVNRLRRELAERNGREGYPYRLSFSVGVARFDPDAPPSIEELLAAADAMLYEQKKHKRPLSAV